MVCEIQYGGRITDWVDLDLFYAYGHEWLDEKIMNAGFTFNNDNPPNARNFKYIIPDGIEVQKYRDFIDIVPEKDSPAIFGLHENADLAKRKRESIMMLDTIMMT
jgi:dynein heavy chain